MSYFITIANEKGGVAKTTTTLSLAAGLAELGNKVLMIDLDSQANLTIALGKESGKGNPSLVSVLLGANQISNVIQNSDIPGLDLIPSSGEMANAERFLPARDNYLFSLINLFNAPVLSKYDTVIMDCPPFLGAVTQNALMSTDLLIIPTQPEYFSIHALKNMMSLIRTIRNQGNIHLTYRILITMFDVRNKIHRTMQEQLRMTFANGLLETLINTDTKLRESPVAGLPVLNYAPHSRAATQYRALAQEIYQYVQEAAAQPT